MQTKEKKGQYLKVGKHGGWYMPLILDRKPEMEGWSWDKHRLLDDMTHKEQCAVCREGYKLHTGEQLYSVKNRQTRQYIHVVAQSSEDARDILGWLDVPCWVMLVERGPVAGGMSEETKAKLRAYNAAKRGNRPKIERPVKPQREIKVCERCGGNYMNFCFQCEEIDGDPLTEPADCDTLASAMDASTLEGKEVEDMTLPEFVREFVESQVMEKNDKGKPECNFDKLFQLAKANDLDVGKYRKDVKENPGRIRMTIGNMIRGAATKNGRLVTLGGGGKVVPAALLPEKKEKAKPVAKKKEKKEKKTKVVDEAA